MKPSGVLHLVRLYRKAYGAYTPQVILIVVLAVVSSILEGLGISSVIPAFSFVGGEAGSATDTISQMIAGLFGFFHLPYTFRMLLFFIGGLFITRTIVLFFIQVIAARIVYGYQRDLRRALFSNMMYAGWPFLSRQRIGNLEQLLTTNTAYASQIFSNISTSALIVSKILMYIVVAVNVSWWVAAASLLIGIVISFVLKPIFYRTRTIGVEAERTTRGLAHFVGEHVIGMKALKAMALEAPVVEKANALFERMRYLNLRSVILRSYLGTIVQLTGVVFVAIVFVIMYRSPGFSIAAFGVIVYAMNQIFSQIQAGQEQLHTVIALTPYIEGSLSYVDEAKKNVEAKGGDRLFSIKKEVAFKDVSFSYPGRDAVLSHVSFSLPKGSLTGIIGPSGAGKTTIADLLLRLVEPESGTIFADDLAVREIPVAAWRTHIGYVSQDAVLLNDTIESNISFYDPSVTREGVVKAAKLANVHDFIEGLPQGYDTHIGDRGILLSGGQRQRVALARVLARKPELLVLDEATSSLDAESERAIQAAIEGLHGDITVLVIAHRMTTVGGADRILVVDRGTVVESGTPHDLLSKPDSYYNRMTRSGALDSDIPPTPKDA